MNTVIKILGGIFHRAAQLIERLRCKYLLLSFAQHGSDCHLEGVGSYSCRNIYIGNKVFIGGGAISCHQMPEL